MQMKLPSAVVWVAALPVVTISMLLFVVALVYCITSIGWGFVFRQPPAHDWASRTATEFATIRSGMESYRKDRGRYPDTLSQLLPSYLPSSSAVPGGTAPASGSLHYVHNSERTQYLLWRSCNHWVSSFDVLLYRSDLNYGGAALAYERYYVGECLYIVGGSDIIEAQEQELNAK